MAQRREDSACVVGVAWVLARRVSSSARESRETVLSRH